MCDVVCAVNELSLNLLEAFYLVKGHKRSLSRSEVLFINYLLLVLAISRRYTFIIFADNANQGLLSQCRILFRYYSIAILVYCLVWHSLAYRVSV